MNQDRIIFHIDVNSAFLSWSALKALEENPGSVDLRTIPSAVGGDIKTRHGVITAKSIPAKAYGVETGEPVVKALGKCPQLVLVKSDFEAYRRYSAQFIRLLKEFTPLIQQASIDEAYMDATDLRESFSGDKDPFPICAARKIKDSVRERLGFTVNVGISTNRFLAKMASDFQKPDRIHTLYPEEIEEKLWPLPIRSLYGCGEATAVKLQTIGIHTIGDAAHAPLILLQNQLGNKMGSYILERANGRADDQIVTRQREAKSYSNEITTSQDISASNYATSMPPLLKKLCEKVAGRLKKDEVWGSTVSIQVKTGSFQRHSRQRTLPASTNDVNELYDTCEGLMDELLLSEHGLFARGEVIRLVGVGVSGLDKGEYRQMDLFHWAAENQQRQAEAEKRERDSRLEDAAKRERNSRLEDAAKRERNSRLEDAAKRERSSRLDDAVKKVQKRYGKEVLQKGKDYWPSERAELHKRAGKEKSK